jgi:hypothetical protein
MRQYLGSPAAMTSPAVIVQTRARAASASARSWEVAFRASPSSARVRARPSVSAAVTCACGLWGPAVPVEIVSQNLQAKHRAEKQLR